MSWGRTYSHNVLIGFDSLIACIVFNRSDLTVSTLCRLKQAFEEYMAMPFGVRSFPRWAPTLELAGRYKNLGLHHWQDRLLGWLYPLLNWMQKDHCELARLGDLERADSMDTLLRLTSDPPAK